MWSDVLFLFKDFLNQSKGLSKKDKQFIYQVVIKAIRNTRTHISVWRKGKIDAPSGLLSIEWQIAALEIQKLNLDENLKWFGKTLQQKSKYWSDPEGYDPALFNEYAMRLTEVEEKLNELTQ